MWIFSQSLWESSVCILFFVIRKILPKNKLQLFQMILPHLVHQLNPLQHINYRSLQGFPSFVQCFSPLSFLNQLLKYSIWISTLLFLHLNSFIVINIIVKRVSPSFQDIIFPLWMGFCWDAGISYSSWIFVEAFSFSMSWTSREESLIEYVMDWIITLFMITG